MASQQNAKRKRARKTPQPLLDKGIQVLLLAVGLGLISVFLGNNPMLSAISKGLRSILWVPLLIGLVLVALHFVLKRRVSPSLPDLRDPMPEDARTSSEPVISRSQQGGGSPGDADPNPMAQRLDPFLDSTPSLDVSRPGTPSRELDRAAPPARESTWSSKVFAGIEWRRFEAVVEALSAQTGFETRSQSHGADGGVDIWLYSRHAEGPVAVVQCKHWHGKPVTVKEMREFLGVMVSKGVRRGTYATTSRFTSEALAFAQSHGINAQDGPAAPIQPTTNPTAARAAATCAAMHCSASVRGLSG